MTENGQESEPLLDEADYEQIIRGDSLLDRMGSNNFVSLIESPAPPIFENEVLRPQEHHQYQPSQQQQFQDTPDFHTVINTALSLENSRMSSHQLPLESTDEWFNIENVQEPSPQSRLMQLQDPLEPKVDSSSISMMADSTPNHHMPSLQSWPGQYDFKLSLPVGNKDKNKWCYSSTQNKLYLCNFTTVPIQVNLLQWFDGSITITPVFKDSRHRVDPVTPCFNCKSKVSNAEVKEHLVMVEGQECMYKQVNDRNVVTIPLHSPPPGEMFSTLLLKLTCLTSCIGGPNRRPFCLVFTLHDSSGSLVGRQILDLKCCKCPSRDMLNEDKSAQKHQHHSQSSNEISTLDCMQALKRSAPATTTIEKKKRFDIKLEPGMENRYKYLAVPVEHHREMKAYLNCLIAKAYVKKHHPDLLINSEDVF